MSKLWWDGRILQGRSPTVNAAVAMSMTNPKLDFGCAEWCPYAEQCIGAVPEEVKAKQKMEQENSLRERISLEMKKYFGKDLKRINHALKVARYAEQIMKMEGGNPLVVLGAAYLHDIGILKRRRNTEAASGDIISRRQKGVPIAREILKRLAVQKRDGGGDL